MTAIYVREQGATVRSRGERLLVTMRKEKLMDLPLDDVEQLVLVGRINLTPAAMAALMERGIDVSFVSTRGGFRGRLLNEEPTLVALRKAQMECASDSHRSLVLARWMVAGKLANQRTLLQRRLRAAPAGEVASTLRSSIAGIDRMRKQAEASTTAETLRGCEGKAGADYFAGMRALIDPALGFRIRAYHPPPDPVNAALSFGYALLLKDSTAAAQIVGLDPYTGFFHTIRSGRPSLALDLMEEFRAPAVDSMVLGLLSRRRLGAADFVETGRSDRPIELSEAAVQVFLQAYEQRMTTRARHPQSGENTTFRRCIELQARQVARYVRGEADRYVPYVAR